MLDFIAKTFAILALMTLPVTAQDHSTMDHGKDEASEGEQAESTIAYKDAMDVMHKGMMIDYTGNTDVDFVRGMIPHHQGAIDMAEIVLEDGEDPEIRKLAEDIIEAQEREIEMMTKWLEENDTPE